MSADNRARWMPAALTGCFALVVAAVSAFDGDLAAGLVAGGLLLGLTWWQWPTRGGAPVRHQNARDRHARDGTVLIYWRPGCWYCSRLRVRLGRVRRRAIWVNVWVDGEASQFVRRQNDGNETVPTVLLGDAVLANPDPAEVRRALVGRALG